MSDAALDRDRPGVRAAVAKRLAARYRAERRFQFYCVAAVGVAALALVTLVASIATKGAPAFVAYELTLDIDVPQSVDPDGSGDPAVIRRANFTGMIQASLRAAFPEVRDRRALRDLFSLVSSINAATVRDRVVADPSLVGQTIAVAVPISDDVDLYFKGFMTDREERAGRGAARVEIAADAVSVQSASDDFADVLAQIREGLAADEARLEAEAERVAAIAAVESDAARAQGQTAQAEALRARAAALRERLAAGALEIGPDEPSVLVRARGGVVKAARVSAARVDGAALTPLDGAGDAAAGAWSVITLATPEADRRVNDAVIVWAETLRARGQVRRVFNGYLFTRADSREPELAGMKGALIGSVLTMLVTMLMAVPVGVATAIYLEEFAPKNRWTDLVEVNINNLAAVPSIVFGLLGLAVFINFFALPRSAPLVGGMVLALMTLPTVIISTRAALKAVPPSIRTGALGVGASRVQAVFHHVLPLAAPGILTGSIIGLAQALGETAPLLMIGMVAFVADAPSSLTSPATVMPVQIYLWSDSAERAFEYRTSALIMSLLAVMVVLNLIAVVLRRRFERRW